MWMMKQFHQLPETEKETVKQFVGVCLRIRHCVSLSVWIVSRADNAYEWSTLCEMPRTINGHICCGKTCSILRPKAYVLVSSIYSEKNIVGMNCDVESLVSFQWETYCKQNLNMRKIYAIIVYF